eukprot:639985-Alexandrium_andersonii.AAC.1
MDCYLRSHEWCQIRAQDVSCDGERVTIMLGVPERGERVKTGYRQGVIIDGPDTAQAVLSLAKARKPYEPLFSVGITTFNNHWEKAKSGLGLSW